MSKIRTKIGKGMNLTSHYFRDSSILARGNEKSQKPLPSIANCLLRYLESDIPTIKIKLTDLSLISCFEAQVLRIISRIPKLSILDLIKTTKSFATQSTVGVTQ